MSDVKRKYHKIPDVKDCPLYFKRWSFTGRLTFENGKFNIIMIDADEFRSYKVEGLLGNEEALTFNKEVIYCTREEFDQAALLHPYLTLN